MASEMKRRRVNDPRVEVRPCAGADFIMGVLLLVCRLLRCPRTRALTWGWKWFGFNSRRHIRDADVLHVRSGAGQGGAIRCAKRRGIKVLTDHSIAHPAFMEEQLRGEYERNHVFFYMGISSPFWRLVAQDCLDADHLLVNSDFVKETFIQAGFPKEKISVVYLGTRSDFWGLHKTRGENKVPRLLFTGSFEIRKGAEYILRALELLKKRGGPAMRLDVVGWHKGSQKLMEILHVSDLPITFHGQVPQDDLKMFLTNADIYVFPSLAEGCACSGMEAMAAGLCVVATHESGLPITDGETGFIVPSKDAQAIADKLEWLHAHPMEMDRVGANAARLIATEYTWEKYAEKVEKVYRELTA